ncbi:DNA polymerase delta, catalytic subunit [Giardia duodenalis ATCC 50581]|uniref:DNA polymerase n=1 Tax=Giardia intestinalis (strain ATCC 50581 / GS clone H7) TaxID=598745 RepID=C6LR97_GIAIB|nr:DNA polymerase delta, catalytic subunit [Giardia intestinalis ATCC 50581]
MEQLLLSLRRPSVGPEVYEEDIEFQLIDVLDVNIPTQNCLVPKDSQSGKKAPLSTNYVLFGITRDGQSVSTVVTGFRHYLYAGTDTPLDPLELQLKLSLHLGFEADGPTPITSIIQLPSTYRSIYVFRVQKRHIYKISFTDKGLYSTIRGFFLDNHIYNGKYGLRADKFELYEADLDPTVRFMVDTQLRGFAWVCIPKERYTPLPTDAPKPLQTTMQIQLQTEYTHLVALNYNDPCYAINAPIRVLSFDIESVSLQGGFPDAASDYIITICSSLYILTQSTADTPHANIALVLHSCAPIVGADVFCFDTERELLLAFNYLIQLFDPDIFTGYNIDGFDFNYIFKRAEVSQVSTHSLPGFMGTDQLLGLMLTKGSSSYASTLTRSLSSSMTITVSHLQSKQVGKRDTYEINCPGRMSMDILPNIIHNYKLRSYTLNSVCARFLNEQKDDVHYSMITPLFMQNEYGRRRITSYCIKDCKLPLKLMEKLMILVNTIELCRVSGLCGCLLLYSGQQIRILSLLYRFSAAESYLIPYRMRTGGGHSAGFSGDSEGLEGATVLNPKRGFYSDKQPIATLDFNSLYPTIIIAHNLCYSTMISDTPDIDFLIQMYAKSRGEDLSDINVSVYRQQLSSLLRLEGASISATVDDTNGSDDSDDSDDVSRSSIIKSSAAQKDTATLCLSASNELITVTPIKARFLKKTVFPGILPKILQVLLDARKKAKQDMKKATDPLAKDVLNGRQLALKLIANSLYGFTGALTFGRLPSQEISSSITAFGREMINHTKNVVEERFQRSQSTIEIDITDSTYATDAFVKKCLSYCDTPVDQINLASEPEPSLDERSASPPAGIVSVSVQQKLHSSTSNSPSPPRLAPDGRIICPKHHNVSFNAERTMMYYRIIHDSVVIYGDTDSVMVKFGVDNIMEAMMLAKYASTYVTQSFIRPINLEFEKVYCPYLLLNKKRYAGQYWTNPFTPDKIDSKGLELVRRDNCRLVVIVMEKVLDILFNYSDPQRAINYVKSVVHDLISQRVDLSLLVISKALTQSVNSYTNKQQTHVNLAIRMTERDPMTAPKVGDRVPYVVTLKDKACKLFERSEDPAYAISNNLPIDTDYYLHQQLEKPVSRLLKDVLRCSSEAEAADQLFRGKHCVGPSIVFSRGDIGSALNTSSTSTGSSKPAKATKTSKQTGIMGMIAGKKVAKCMYCNIRITDGQLYEDIMLCKSCLLTNRLSLYSHLQRELLLAEHRYRTVAVECMFCTGEISSHTGDIEDGLIPCSSSDCELFYARIKTRLDYKALRAKFDALANFTWS